MPTRAILKCTPVPAVDSTEEDLVFRVVKEVLA